MKANVLAKRKTIEMNCLELNLILILELNLILIESENKYGFIRELVLLWQFRVLVWKRVRNLAGPKENVDMLLEPIMSTHTSPSSSLELVRSLSQATEEKCPALASVVCLRMEEKVHPVVMRLPYSNMEENVRLEISYWWRVF